MRRRMQPADAAVSRRMNISWYAAKWRRHAPTQISLRQMRGQSTSQITGEERFDEKEEDTERVAKSFTVPSRAADPSFGITVLGHFRVEDQMKEEMEEWK
ncbi:hypothetical protein M8J77_025441 [Diaphorina citri]|nr:hypothetical protein M8J77_025441 [Diaphorina citri]